GAAKVFAVDVGKGQLHHSLAADQRVINLEQRDARSLTCELVPEPPSLIVCDVSFIGAVKALARPLSLATEHADLVVLIKPQFEAGPRASKSGVLERDVARAAAQNVVRELDGLEGFRIKAVIDSPIRGGDGNLEMLAH